MILVDTSVWIDHLRRGDARLVRELGNGEVCCHPFVVGELACGNLKNRAEILDLLGGLEQCGKATDEEVLGLIEGKQLNGRGLGLIDVHLIASCLVVDVRLWTRDRALRGAAMELGVAAGLD